MEKANRRLAIVLPIHTRHHLPHNGTHVVARPTLRLRLRFPLVRGLHCGGYVERPRYQGGSQEGEDFG